VGFVLTLIGLLLFLVSLAAVAFGLFMAADPKNRDQGRLFAIWWVPGVAAAGGVLMRDVVTFAVGLLCFLVAGAVFTFAGAGLEKPTVKHRGGTPGGDEGSETTTKENKSRRGYGKAAS
jgi:hypothetical protein